ncbi:toxin co-regulated pilus biosynthesis Q family protein [Rhizobium sp. BK176]|uniref:toxin co-regulated pilus biosynthesis Q family protein n=1 Tax=Rhizobium sp. BK176 TaxID=2587071 RepID=UPI0021684888|nr:toxin co-regulated pilus biosynthesis Q family protein [Rhizobium sp. BK176]MCS4089472.1 hypothetical protein [Rhizobium sp. BK176]
MKSLRSTLILGSLVVGLGVMNSGSAFAAFDSFGSDIPLESAAKQIVPEGFTVDYGAGVDKSTSVTWGSAPDWQSALSSAVAKKGLKAEIGSGTVVIVKAKASEARPYSSTPSKDIVQKKGGTERKRAPKPHAAPAPRVEPRDPPAARETAAVGGGGFTIRPYRDSAKSGEVLKDKEIVDAKKDGFQKYEGKGSFIVEEGYMLHSTLNTWADATGWKVIWNSEHDYLIEANATFTGDFVKASSDLIKAMGDARPQITVDYYTGNKVIVISNKLSDEVNR